MSEYDPSEPLHAVKYRVNLSVRYHRMRERFLALCDNGAKACALIASTAAFHALANESGNTYWSYAVIALFTFPSLLSLAFSLSTVARRHAELAQKFLQLEADILAKDFWDVSPEDINRWESALRIIEISEPPALSYLVRICQNQIAEFENQPDKIVKLNPLKKAFAQVFSFS